MKIANVVVMLFSLSFSLSSLSSLTANAADTCKGNPDANALANEGDAMRTTNVDGAIEKYKSALAIDPDNHRIALKLALAHAKKEAWHDATLALDIAIRIAPKNAYYRSLRGHYRSNTALASLASSSASSGKKPDPNLVKEAAADLEAALAIDPNLADAHFDLADLNVRLNQEKEALIHYTRAAELKPNETTFYAALADLYIRLGYPNQAHKTLTEGIAFTESRQFALFVMLGQIEQDRGNNAIAVTHFEAAKKSCGMCNERGEQIIYFELGAAYATMKPPRKAESIVQLQSFAKLICKGAAAARYADQCMQAQQIATSIGGSLN